MPYYTILLNDFSEAVEIILLADIMLNKKSKFHRCWRCWCWSSSRGIYLRKSFFLKYISNVRFQDGDLFPGIVNLGKKKT